jgi:hypothetical protein
MRRKLRRHDVVISTSTLIVILVILAIIALVVFIFRGLR